MAMPEPEVASVPAPATDPDLQWYEKSEETPGPQVDLFEAVASTQEPSNSPEPFFPGDCLVPVVFPGPVSQEGCCQFTCELLKHIMYQRQQLPLPYEQLKHFYRRSPQAEDVVRKKPRTTTEASSRKCQQALAELESVLGHLQDFFSRTLVPRVLILLGGNALSPKEFYELDLSRLAPFCVDQCVSTAACLRRLFRAIFMADAFNELQAPPLMGTIVMVQGHRDCGEDWFRPKLNYRMPSRGHKLTVTLSCGRLSIPTMATEDYIWFQAPVTLKGFHE